MSHITTEQALQIPQQLQKQGSNQGNPSQTDASDEKKEKILRDDSVTLFRQGLYKQVKTVNVNQYKGELGQDNGFVKETLRNKLAEYNLNPRTKLEVKKNLFGEIEINGSLRPDDHAKLTLDLNNNAHFKQAFDRLNKQQPTLNYVDNVVKISKAYGVNNNLFDSLISEKDEHNRLNDIAHRYEAMKTTNTQSAPGLTETDGSEENEQTDHTYQFVLNG